MSVLRLSVVNFWLRHVGKRYLSRETDFARARRSWDRMARMVPASGLRHEPLRFGGRSVPAGRIDGAGNGPLLLWLHGGAYCMGSSGTHAAMVGALARRLGGPAVIPDYRLAPEHPFPAAVDDVFCAYQSLVEEGLPEAGLVLGGDSAGGGLVFALLHLILRGATALPLPRAVVAFSPWVDLTESGESLRTLARRDVMLPVERFGEIRDVYLAGADPRDPRASPVFGAFAGAPPVLILSSEHEVLRDDARMMAARLRSEGVAVRHREWPGLPHVWPLFTGFLPQAAHALEEASSFALSEGLPA